MQLQKMKADIIELLFLEPVELLTCTSDNLLGFCLASTCSWLELHSQGSKM